MDSIEQTPAPSEYLHSPNSLLQYTNESKFKIEDFVEENPQYDTYVEIDSKKPRNISESEPISRPKIKLLKKIANTACLDTKLENKSDAKSYVKNEPLLDGQEVAGSNITGK